MHERAGLLATHQHRKVAFVGACNVRDLGGLPTTDGRITRRGVVYRSDTLAFLSDADLVRLEALAVRAVVDLRTEEEQLRAPDRMPTTADITVHHAGFMPNGNAKMLVAINEGRMTAEQAHAAMLCQYRSLALDHLDRYREYLAVLLAERTPLIFHCASGKDRTGVAAAITLLAVGVPYAVVIEDYVVSNYQRRKVDLFGSRAPAATVDKVMAADASYIEAAIAAMSERFGSIDGYLTDGVGLNVKARATLRRLMVE